MSLVQALSAQPQIANAIQQASVRTGADFNYLLNTAMRESSLNCNAKSNTSTACGLFQFTQQTWFGMLKTEGAELGLGQYADKIRQTSSGRYVVDDPADRQEILALRKDARASALMAGAYANNSRQQLESKLGRQVNSGELYIAHFLGAGGATRLISQAEDAPQARADMLFPAAAAANKSIFYDKSGEPRTACQVYDLLISKHGATGNADIAPRPRMTSRDVPAKQAYIPAAAPTMKGEGGYAIAVLPMMTVSAGGGGALPAGRAPAMTLASVSDAMRVADGIGLNSIRLSPDILNVLAALDASPEDKSGKPDDREENKLASRPLSRGGFDLG